MKKSILFFFVFFIAMVSVSFAQKSNGGYPLSFLKVGLQEEIDEIVIDNPSIEDLRLEDSVREINNQLFRVGVRIPVEINIDNFGTWDLLEDGTRVWRLKITSYNAKSITLLYDSFNLTSGCELFLYNDNRKQLLGSFNYNTNPTETGKFSTQMIAGESTYLELNISPECIEMPTIDIEGIIYNYRSVDGFVNYYYDGKETGFGSSGDCHPNVNCPEGYDWQNEKKGIALIFVIDGFSAGFCSGSLINNTAFDGTPYFLTAEHCGGSVPAEDLAQWQFYFNYEAVDCEDPVTEPSYETIIGAEFRAKGEMNGGSDFLLLELMTTDLVLNSIGAYYNGWNRSTIAATNGVFISHPAGDIKKIATSTDTLITDTYTGCYPGSQWKAVWSPTESGYGVTEGGASGAPFLNQEHLIVGTLTGGASYCGASQNMSYDYFGKFDYHWASNGQSNIERLKPWLDPGNVGSYICQGYYPTSTFGMVQGQIYNDINQNCSIDDFEHGIGSYIVEIMPGNITISTNSYGIYSIDSLPEGTYYVTVDTTNQNWNPTCPVTQELIISNSQSVTYAPSFGFYSDQACSDPSISVYAPILRRCFDYQELYVVAHNQYAATSYLEEAYVILELDELISINSSNIPFVELGNSEYRFDIGNVGPGQTISIALLVEVSCDAVLSQTLCMSAKLFPIDECALDNSTNIPGGATGDIPECTLPWDHSSLNVDGWCENDSIYFLITNTGDFGDGDMQCVSPVRIFIDGVLTQVESIQLDGQETYMYAFEATGQTWRLEVDQHPLHPGNSYPNAVVELCGDIVNWVPGYIDSQYQDDADPVVDIFCGQIVGSYDPNDKSQSPTGVGELGFIGPNQMLEYRIRFQNTGNDTAFTVVVKDTLDSNLNLFTVVPGVASHDYEFSIENGRVLVWTFNDILLVDSITNEPESHGFLTFKVEQNPDLPYGTVINNDADIYFDFNDPVITNELVYTIYDFNPLLLSQSIFFANEEVSVFPNPADEVLNICFTKTDSDVKGLFKIVDLTGKEIYIEGFSTKSSDYTINIEGLDSGIYILITFMENTMYANRFVVK